MQTDKPVQRAPIPRLAVSPPPITTTPRSVPGIVPELHAIVAESGRFLLNNNDGRTRMFLNLEIGSDPHRALLAFFDPESEDECQIFDAWRSKAPALTQLDQKNYLGAAILISTVDQKGQLEIDHLLPSELTDEGWKPAGHADMPVTHYFRDKAGRMALGYRMPSDEPRGWTIVILSGPADLRPVECHRALPECGAVPAPSDHASPITHHAASAAATLTGGVQ